MREAFALTAEIRPGGSRSKFTIDVNDGSSADWPRADEPEIDYRQTGASDEISSFHASPT